MNSKVLGRPEDHTNIPTKPKSGYQKQRPSPHVMVPTKETNYVMHDNSNPVDTFAVGSGLESAHSLFRGKTIVGGVDGFGSSKLQTTLITPFEKIRKKSTTINLIAIAPIHSVGIVN